MAAILYALFFILLALFNSANAADTEDPYDLSFYTKGAAIGDS